MKKAVALVAMALGLPAAQAQAQDPMLGEVVLVGFNFCPRGYAEAAGQLLSISQNTALFSLYGTTYGGDGQTTFALPDLRGRVPIGQGQGPGLSDRPQGSRGGQESITVGVQNMPSHDHGVSAQLNASGSPAGSPSPGGNLPALSQGGPIYGSVPPGGSTQAMAANAVTVSQNAVGGGQPVAAMPPFQTMRYCVATEGYYPSRD